jgi:hypothetical protein
MRKKVFVTVCATEGEREKERERERKKRLTKNIKRQEDKFNAFSVNSKGELKLINPM